MGFFANVYMAKTIKACNSVIFTIPFCYVGFMALVMSCKSMQQEEIHRSYIYLVMNASNDSSSRNSNLDFGLAKLDELSGATHSILSHGDDTAKVARGL